MDIEEEIYNMVRVERTPMSTYSITMPTVRDVQRLYGILGIRGLAPEPSDPIWHLVEQRVWRNMPTLRKIADQMFTQPANKGTIPMQTTTAPVEKANVKAIDAIVRQMKGPQALAACEQLGIVVKHHPSNNGITAMRAKNALYIAAREGKFDDATKLAA